MFRRWIAARCALLVILALGLPGGTAFAKPFTIRDAINMAVKTYPGVGEAAANRRATEDEMRQTQSTLLPQVRLEASAGPGRTFVDQTLPPVSNGHWLPGTDASIVVRQLLFDGFASIHEIWRQAARVNAAAARVHERSGLAALDAAEAYVDVIRYTRLVALARENVRAHRRILSNVETRFKGGRAGEGDLEQTRERVHAAEVFLTQFQHSLDDARAKFKKVVGIAPYNLRAPGRLAGLPTSRDQALAVTLTDNPTIKAAQFDTDAARQAFHATEKDFLPTISLEGRATAGNNTNNFVGHYNQESVRVVASWDIFQGGQSSWKRDEASQRYIQSSMKEARLQRDAYQSIDKAWDARIDIAQQIAKLRSEVTAGRKVISAYSKEYDLGQRSLIDLLNAENQEFNAEVSLESERGVIIFADYQLLAAMGRLLDYLHAPHPVEAEPLLPRSFGLLPNKLPPMRINLPTPGPEPLNVKASPKTPFDASRPSKPSHASFSSRWSALRTKTAESPLAFAGDIFSPSSHGFTNDIFSSKSMPKEFWLLSAQPGSTK